MSIEKIVEEVHSLSEQERNDLFEILREPLHKQAYGLVWEEHKEPVEELLDTHYPLLVEDKSKAILNADTEPMHLLIEGDNLEVLTLLNNLMPGSCHVAIIDPPYNRGNVACIYNDNFIDKTDTYRHSKWLSFMSKRLERARTLLREDGVLLVNIDEKEMAQLKLLCDKVFGEGNYVNTLAVRRATKSINNQFKQLGSLNQAFENILVYRKSKEFYYKYPYKKSSEKRQEGYWTSFYNNANRPTMRYQIGKITIDKGQWKWSVERGLRAYNNHLTYLKEAEKDTSLTLRDYYMANKDSYLETHGVALEFVKETANSCQYWVKPTDKIVIDTNFMDYYVNDNKGKSLYQFDTVKNLGLLKYLVKILTLPEEPAIVLDFFAGSGTLGNAILELNKEQGAKHQFILCTSNENNICEQITYNRLRKVIEGSITSQGKTIEGTGGNLKYLKSHLQDKGAIPYEHLLLLVAIKENAYTIEERGQGVVFLKNATTVIAVCNHHDTEAPQAGVGALEILGAAQEEKVCYTFGAVATPLPGIRYENLMHLLGTN